MMRAGLMLCALILASCAHSSVDTGAAVHSVASTHDESWRTHPPKLARSRTFVLPTPSSRTLANGFKILVVENHRLPLVAMRLVSRASTAAAPMAKAGLADVTLAAMTSSAAQRTAIELADSFAEIGTNLTSGVDRNLSYLATDVESAQLVTALGLVADIVMRPEMDAKAIDRAREDVLARARARADRVGAVAEDWQRRLTYGPDHPYGVWDSGTPRTITNIERNDVLQFYRGHWRPDNTALVLVGDVTPERAWALLAPLFGAWKPAGTSPLASIPGATDHSRHVLTLIDRPGAAQTALSIGHLGLTRSSPDWAATMVLNYILGGNYSSRLNLDLSMKKGFTYVLRSYLTESVAAGQFVIRAAIKNDKVAAAIGDILGDVERLTREPPDEAEVEAAKNAALTVGARLDTSEKIAEEIALAFALRLPADHLARFVQAVAAVSTADVVAAARDHLRPERMNIVIVGPAAAIDPQLRAARLGPIERPTASP